MTSLPQPAAEADPITTTLSDLFQRVEQLRHDIIAAKQLLIELQHDSEAFGNPLLTVNTLLEKVDQFGLWIHQMNEDFQIASVPVTCVDTSVRLIEDIHSAEAEVNRLVINAMELERQLLTAAEQAETRAQSQEEGDEDNEQQQQQQQQQREDEFFDCVEETGRGISVEETKASTGEEEGLGHNPALCMDDAQAMQLFASVLGDTGLDPQHWSECPEMTGDDAFKVRGKNYLRDKHKIVSPGPAFMCVGVQLVSLEKRCDNVGNRLSISPLFRLPAQLQHRTFLLLNWQIPGTPVVQVMCYFMLKHEYESCDLRTVPVHSSEPGNEWLTVVSRFWQTGDDFRDARFKLIPRLVNAPWAIKKLVGNKPALLGRKLKQRYFSGPNHLEVDIDLGSSIVAARILAMVRDMSSSMTVDMAITFQGEEVDELPERVVCGVRFIAVNFSTATPADGFIAVAE